MILVVYSYGNMIFRDSHWSFWLICYKSLLWTLVALLIIYCHWPCISNFRGNNDHFPNILVYGTFYVLKNTYMYIQTISCQNKFFCNLSWVGVLLKLRWMAYNYVVGENTVIQLNFFNCVSGGERLENLRNYLCALLGHTVLFTLIQSVGLWKFLLQMVYI